VAHMRYLYGRVRDRNESALYYY